MLSKAIAQPNNSVMEKDYVSKFLKSTHEQIERFKELRNYSPKLLSFRKELSKEGIKCTFAMYTTLIFRIASPVDRFEITVHLKEFNTKDVVLYSSLIPYSIVFEDCFTGQDLFKRLKDARLLSYPRITEKPTNEDYSKYSHGGQWL